MTAVSAWLLHPATVDRWVLLVLGTVTIRHIRQSLRLLTSRKAWNQAKPTRD